MNVTDDNKEQHLNRLIGGSFIASVVASIIGWFFPPDFSVDPPKISEISLMMGHLQTAFVILGCTALGIKLAEEKQTMAAIGFTMMAITQGVIFVLYLIAPEPSKENMDEVFKLFVASLFLLLPSLLLIAMYSHFPKWVNILGVVAALPWTIESILYFSTHKMTDAVGLCDFLGQLLFDATFLCWAIFILKKRKITFIRPNP